MSEIDVIMPFAISLLTLGSFFLGKKVRSYGNVIYPWMDPISVLLTLAILSPWYRDSISILANLSFLDPDNIWVQATVLGIACGYFTGYILNQPNIVYVGVHNIPNKTQEVYPIVYYYRDEEDGTHMYIQPQTFSAVIKTMIFGVRYPLDLPLNMIQRKRHVSIRKILIRADADEIDLAGHEVSRHKVKRGPFTFTVESHRYIATPYATDAPYDWILNASKYDELFTRYNELQVESMESQSELQMASVKGAGNILKALGRKVPNNMFLDELDVNLSKSMEREKLRNRKKAQQESIDAQAGQEEMEVEDVSE